MNPNLDGHVSLKKTILKNAHFNRGILKDQNIRATMQSINSDLKMSYLKKKAIIYYIYLAVLQKKQENFFHKKQMEFWVWEFREKALNFLQLFWILKIEKED